MAKLLTGSAALLPPRLSSGIADGPTGRAVRSVEDHLSRLTEQLSKATIGVGDLAVFTRTDNGIVPAPGGSGSSRFLREDGTWAVPSGSGVSGNLSIAAQFVGNNSSHAVITLSEGDIDWFAPLAIPGGTSGFADHWLTSATVHHTKLDGPRWCLLGSSAIYNQGGNFAIFNTMQRNSVITDDADGVLSSNNTVPYLQGFSAAGCGWKVVVPAATTTRVLRLYIGHFSADITVKAHLSDGSAADVTASSNPGSGVAQEDKFTVTFNSSDASAYLVVKATVNTLYTGGNIGFGAVTLATV